jgi:2-phospho-L-lactate guanylyltransferase
VNRREVWVVVPIKDTTEAKQRLGPAVSASLRPALALAMAEDVLCALAAAPGVIGIYVVTIDPAAGEIAARYGARVITEGARDGQTGAVAAAAKLLARENRRAMLTIPGDVPLITAEEVERIIAAHERFPDFVIAPAHDERGSNAVLCAPPDAVPLRFGNDSFLPHLEAARHRSIEPRIIRLAGIGLDLDNPRDLARFLQIPSATRARALLERSGLNQKQSGR